MPRMILVRNSIDRDETQNNYILRYSITIPPEIAYAPRPQHPRCCDHNQVRHQSELLNVAQGSDNQDSQNTARLVF